MLSLSSTMAPFASHPLSELVLQKTKPLAKRLAYSCKHKAYTKDTLGVFAGFCISVFLRFLSNHVLIYVFACGYISKGRIFITYVLTYETLFLFIFCILFEKLGHISPSNLCELQIRPFRPLLLTFMNRKLGGRPNICASVFFINSTDLTHYSFKIQNEIETRPISPSIRKPSRSNQLLNRD